MSGVCCRPGRLTPPGHARTGRLKGNGRRWQSRRGSIVLLVLFFCLAGAVIIQGVVGVLLCAQRSLVDEAEGRDALAARERGLELARVRALEAWGAAEWDDQVGGSPESVTLHLALEPTLPVSIWTLGVSAQGVVGSGLTLTALVERGRDGLDLPVAALVAEMVSVPSERSLPWVTVEEAEEEALVFLVHPPAAPAGCPRIEILPGPWHLDHGWRNLISGFVTTSTDNTEEGQGGGLIAPAQGVTIVRGEQGQSVRPPASLAGEDPDHPGLLVLAGEAVLDLSGRGDWWGVVVADGGRVTLEGTLLHGAVLASGEVELGATGQVVFDRRVLRWATDRSLWRARLMPGSRTERVE